MKQKMKKVLSLVLSVVLAVTGLTITPPTRTDVQAASSDGVFITDKIVPVGETSEDYSHMLYWKGQELELSIAVFASYQKEITWETSDSAISLQGESDTTTAYTGTGGSGYVVKQKFLIGDNASGDYVITAKYGNVSKEFQFKVQDSYMTSIASTKLSDFTQYRWTKDEIDLYVITKAGVDVDYTTNNPDLITITSKDSCDSSKLYYYGKGSTVHKVTAVVADKINNETQIDNAIIIATPSIGEADELALQIGQSASHIDDSSIKVTCNDPSHTHEEITHIEGDTIKLDSIIMGSEDAKVTAVLEFDVVGSIVDPLIYATEINKQNVDIKMSNKVVDKENNKIHYEFTLSELKSASTSFDVDFITESTHMTAKTMPIIVYEGNIKDGFEVKYNNAVINNGLVLDEGQKGKFSVSFLDGKEKVEWSVTGATGIITIDKETGEFVTNGSSDGTATVTATVKETNSGVRGQTSSFSLWVKKIVPPDAIDILDSQEQPATATTLYVGDEPTTFYRYATKNGSTSGIYYPNYQHILTDKAVASLVVNSEDNTVTIEPKKQGTTSFYIQTADGAVSSRSVELKVIAPIKTLTIKRDGKAIDESFEAVEEREFELFAARDDAANKVEEKVVWTSNNNSAVKFLDADGNECDEYTGDTCRVRTKGAGSVIITAKATGLDNRSKAISSVSLLVKKRIPTKDVSFFVMENGTGEIKFEGNNSMSSPYEIKSGETVNFKIKGYDENGAVSNDEFSGGFESTASNASVKWSDDNGGFVVTAGNQPGNIVLTFTNKQTGVTYTFYLKVVIPATNVSIKDGNGKVLSTGLVLQEGDECRIYAAMEPINSTDSVSWYSSDSSIVSVTQQGDVKVEKYSDSPVTITAEATSGKKATCEVRIVKPITNITLSAKDAQGNNLKLDGTDVMYISDTVTASAIILPADATDKYDWSSSNASAATVTTNDDGSCVITAKAQGVATISATPRLATSAVEVAKSFVITVAIKPSSLDIKNANGTTGTSIVTTGIDLYNNASKTVYAVLDPSNSYDFVSWTAEPADVVEIKVKNERDIHSCEIKKIKSGETATLTATTSNGISKTIEVRTGTGLSECEITPIANKVYDGTAYRPTVTIKDLDGNVLTSGVDYTVTYPIDTTNVGTKEISITGKGKFCDTIKASYEITPMSIASATVKINNGNNYTYKGEEITLKPGNGILVTVPLGNLTKTLMASDYEVTCVNNINAGTATATITGKGNFTGTMVRTFIIEPKDVSRLTVTMESMNVEYTGEAVCPALIVKDGTKELKAGTDYTVSYINNVEAGNNANRPTAIVTGIGNYTGTRSTNFSITPQTLTVDNVKLSKTDYTYNGKNCKPKVTVRNSIGKKLKVNVDYTIMYPTDMTNIGIKKIVITGKGSYKGNITVEYGIAEKVTVKKASIKKVKNSKAKTVTFEAKKVSGADGYEISYSTTKKFTKDTTKVVTSKKPKKTIKKLQKGKTYYFKVRAYKKNSIGRTIYGKASSVKKVKIKK